MLAGVVMYRKTAGLEFWGPRSIRSKNRDKIGSSEQKKKKFPTVHIFQTVQSNTRGYFVNENEQVTRQ